MMRKLSIALLFVFLLSLSFVKADLPVHCLKHDIIGTWIFKATSLFSVISSHEMKCGHDQPSREDTAYVAEPNLEFRNIATASIDYEGKWTMVYDEGFSIDFEELSFFAFSKYSIEKDQTSRIYKSKCYSTCVGWYRNKDSSQWGCYRGYKVGKSPDSVTYSTISSNDSAIIKTSSILVSNRLTENISEMNSDHTSNLRYSMMMDRGIKFPKPTIMKSFLSFQDKTSLSSQMSSYDQISKYVSNLNKISKSWKAEIHNEFKSLSIRELNWRAGNIRRVPRFKQSQNLISEDLSMYPSNFDWTEKLRPAATQGNCGSCYVTSTIRMIEARLKILLNENVSLSAQHAMDCSIYNQGCNGGYPFLIMKYGKENYFLPEHCSQYKGVVGKCEESCDISRLEFFYGMSDYYYVGGSYGQCSEKKIMEEVYKNGPIVVSFEPDLNFMLYKSGIYHTLDDSSWMSQGLSKPEWQKVDHSVLLVGWGEETNLKEKYWILQNTWGPEWGEKGFFRIRRGKDELGIESICESGTPKIIKNKQYVSK